MAQINSVPFVRNINILYFNGLPSLRESIWTLRQDKPRLSIAIGRELLREPLLKSDKYVSLDVHMRTNLMKISIKC